MKAVWKKTLAVSMICVMMLSMVGCTLFDSKAKVYSRYLTSLLDINYKNVSKDYVTLSGVSEKDAEAVYVANMDHQAHSLMNYYGVKEVDDGTVLSEFYYLAQSMYANAKYEVTDVNVDKDTDTYVLQVTVYPLDTLEATHDQVEEYIKNFNSRVDDGDYNNTNEVDYETEFAEGIIDILKGTVDKPGYMDPVVIDVPIKPTEDYYYVDDSDFLALDKAILYVRENPEEANTEALEGTDEDAAPAEEAAEEEN